MLVRRAPQERLSVDDRRTRALKSRVAELEIKIARHERASALLEKDFKEATGRLFSQINHLLDQDDHPVSRVPGPITQADLDAMEELDRQEMESIIENAATPEPSHD